MYQSAHYIEATLYILMNQCIVCLSLFIADNHRVILKRQQPNYINAVYVDVSPYSTVDAFNVIFYCFRGTRRGKHS